MLLGSTRLKITSTNSGFNGHPPLGVNATYGKVVFQDDYVKGCFNGHPPLGVNAT